ncbi:arabinan endo-1,5-alpha-L-arabinosidase [Roseimarinus sediminis]|uniref:arabinan endo-1,5-alpha-L-arabinosidase n=1 Tax=Roseimarinus sediminis TaxID=1610899 RepID=UPI003D24DB38
MKYSAYLILFLFSMFMFSCKEDEVIPPDNKEDDENPGENYTAPDYPDNYVDIAGWNQRQQWNLANVHDPTVAKDGDYYYMCQTDASYGNAHIGHGHFHFRRSKDLVNWEYRGAAFYDPPAWVKDSLNNMRSRDGLPPIDHPDYGYWAPVLRKVGNQFRLYYSIVVTNPIVGTNTDYSWTERAFIGLAVTDDLASNDWVDKGMVVSSEPDGKETYTRRNGNDWSAYFQFNAIDPSFIETPEGEHWLVYGSWHSGIAAVQLDPETGKPYSWNKLSDYGVRIAGRGNVSTNRWQALEGPEIIYNENTGYYYLFLAYDELSVAYNTRVARSKNITGPYLGLNGMNVTNGAECWPMLVHPYRFDNHPGWVGISHCALFQNPGTGEWFYTSQGRLPEGAYGNPYANAIMMGHVRKVEWTSDGWPVVMPERYAAVPQTAISDSMLVGNWEQIIMEYRYREMQTSVNFTLNSDYTVSGELSGNWSYNAEQKLLTLGNYELIVRNGLDWEADPRTPTLVYSGLTGYGKPVWGKKVE